MPTPKKQKHTPRQMRAVSNQRYDDALALVKTNLNKHANGAMYLGGYVIELLLKARLLEQRPNLNRTKRHSRAERRLCDMIFRYHNLESLLVELPNVKQQLTERQYNTLRQICAVWSVSIRYSTSHGTMQKAGQFLRQIKELRSCLQ